MKLVSTHLKKSIALLACIAGVQSFWAATPAAAQDEIVLCTVDDLSGDFSIMSTPKTYGYRLAVKEINDAGGIDVDGAKKMIKLVSYDGQSDVKRYQELAQRCIFDLLGASISVRPPHHLIESDFVRVQHRARITRT